MTKTQNSHNLAGLRALEELVSNLSISAEASPVSDEEATEDPITF
jgi:hypothetical protein